MEWNGIKCPFVLIRWWHHRIPFKNPCVHWVCVYWPMLVKHSLTICRRTDAHSAKQAWGLSQGCKCKTISHLGTHHVTHLLSNPQKINWKHMERANLFQILANALKTKRKKKSWNVSFSNWFPNLISGLFDVWAFFDKALQSCSHTIAVTKHQMGLKVYAKQHLYAAWPRHLYGKALHYCLWCMVQVILKGKCSLLRQAPAL